jgi:type IV fimbrial biogenesis protein FimT
MRGFSLVELMVAVAVAAILLVIAVPEFRRLIASNQLNTAANELVGTLNVARVEAIKRNLATQFCSDDSTTGNGSDDLGKACGSQGGAVYAPAGAASTMVEIRAGLTELAPQAQLHGHITAIRFTTQGLGYAAATAGADPYNGQIADLCTTAFNGDNHIVVRMTTGSVITTTTTSTGTCP